jgi:S-adenosylmethionine-diacylgycerolhomoserine-N-methlytransferase
MDLRPGDHVIEVACGTARNLIRLAALRPDLHLYGLDASAEMLKTAERKIARRNLSGQIRLTHALAEQLDARAMFGLQKPFDAIFFSYGLSMIPTWPEAIEAALKNLKPGGVLYIVDFWDQKGLPRIFRAFLKRWLALLHVHHRPELLQYLEKMHAGGRGDLSLIPIARRYAYIAVLRTPGGTA